jgi:hypothetical protein
MGVTTYSNIGHQKNLFVPYLRQKHDNAMRVTNTVTNHQELRVEKFYLQILF